MKNLNDGIMTCIGNTPLVMLRNVQVGNFRLFAKLEGANPGGSIKDRPALEIIRSGIDDGKINEDTVIIEATSGNMGLGLAQICCYLGLRLICVVDTKITPQNLRLLKAYGAVIEVVTEPDPVTKDLLQARINRARELAFTTPNAYWSNQYANVCNARAHLRTMDEVMTAMQGEVDYVFCASSSCGTIRGCADYLRSHGLNRTKLYVADSPGSVIFGGSPGPRLIPGHGAGIRPDLYREDLVDHCVQITDMECVMGCRLLLTREALLMGGSSGGILMAVKKVADDIPPGATCVMLFPDRGERYLDTIYSDIWVEENFGAVDMPQKGPQLL
jgi:N-(2-amino-2-carboxyethyl)-L-glutamate synthase